MARRGAAMPAVSYPAPPRAQRRMRRASRWWERLPLPVLIIAGLGLMALLLTPLAVTGSVYAYCQAFGRIYPGVRVGVVDLSWMTRYRAEIVLGEKLGMGGEALVSDGARTWRVPLADLGLSVDPVGTAWAAYNVGRGQPILDEIDQMIAGLRYGWEVTPAVQYDPAAAQAGLQALDVQVALPPENASLVLQGDELVAIPGRLGYAINVEATLEALAADPGAPLSASGLRLALKPVPPAVEDASQARDQAERLLNSDFHLVLYDPISDEHRDLAVPRQSLAAWLKIEAGEQGPVISLDEAQVAAYLEAQAGELGEGLTLDGEKNAPAVAQAVRQGGRPTVIVGHLPTTYTVKSGDTLLKIGWKLGFPMWKLVEAYPG
ncbi:MAG: peptidoglycan binding domain-containing protein, partial [Anaerolineales bacterium]|nr:peptidoglycan binding domain-containing protein [Anaerolineales bacterium]